jgi:hypothetical protein
MTKGMRFKELKSMTLGPSAGVTDERLPTLATGTIPMDAQRGWTLPPPRETSLPGR